jgi:hypothetical protein
LKGVGHLIEALLGGLLMGLAMEWDRVPSQWKRYLVLAAGIALFADGMIRFF